MKKYLKLSLKAKVTCSECKKETVLEFSIWDYNGIENNGLLEDVLLEKLGWEKAGEYMLCDKCK